MSVSMASRKSHSKAGVSAARSRVVSDNTTTARSGCVSDSRKSAQLATDAQSLDVLDEETDELLRQAHALNSKLKAELKRQGQNQQASLRQTGNDSRPPSRSARLPPLAPPLAEHETHSNTASNNTKSLCLSGSHTRKSALQRSHHSGVSKSNSSPSGR